MENNKHTNDTFLADWLAGKLSDDALKRQVGEDDYMAYQKLKSSLGSFGLAKPDLETNYAAVKAKKIAALNRQKPRVVPMFRYAAMAAALLLFFGLYQLFVFSNSDVTGFGQQATVRLPDESVVTLNAKSELSYPSLFNYNRTLKLDGEAYFEVAKGSTFTVETAAGKVRVLGTKFNVVACSDYFEVICYEGKVRVGNDESEYILLAGDAIRFYGNSSERFKEVANGKPRWTTGESAFKRTPFQCVVRALEKQYDKQIEFPAPLTDAKFTGSFTHQNLDVALQSVCVPLNLKINYSEGKIILSE